MTYVIIGRGRVGRGLTRALRSSGQSVSLRRSDIASHRRPSPTVKLVVLAVPDPTIEQVASSLVGRLPVQLPVVHCSGSRTPETLEVLRDAGHPVGVMHPLVSFASLVRGPKIHGTTFTLCGDSKAVSAAQSLCRAIGAKPVSVDSTGPAYHAAAALVANGAVALAAVGESILRELGFQDDSASRAIGALLRTVGENVETLGAKDALTGPIARGDVTTVRAHRNALASKTREAYDRVVPLILASARLGKSRKRAIAGLVRDPAGVA